MCAKIAWLENVVPLAHFSNWSEADDPINVLRSAEIGHVQCARIGAMKPFGLLHQCVQTVDESVCARCASGVSLGAGSDVSKPRPLSAGELFWQLPNVSMSYVGGYVVEYEHFVMLLIVDNMRLVVAVVRHAKYRAVLYCKRCSCKLCRYSRSMVSSYRIVANLPARRER